MCLDQLQDKTYVCVVDFSTICDSVRVKAAMTAPRLPLSIVSSSTRKLIKRKILDNQKETEKLSGPNQGRLILSTVFYFFVP